MRPEAFAAKLGLLPRTEAFRGRRFSVEHLAFLHTQLARFQGCAVPVHSREAAVEQLRALAEAVVHGDSHDPLVFEAFLERRVLDTLLGFALAPRAAVGHAVVTQALQSISIVTQNVRTQSSVYFLLSNSAIDSLCRRCSQFEDDEELLCNYITLLKALALSLTNSTVQFFLADDGAFPLYEQAVRFAASPDPMVVSAVRTIALSVYRLTDERTRRIVLADKPRFWPHAAAELRAHAGALGARLVEAHTAAWGMDGRPPSAAAAALLAAHESAQDLVDGLCFASDAMHACAEPPPDSLVQSYEAGLGAVLLRHWLVPHALAPLRASAQPPTAAHEVLRLSALLLALTQVLLVVQSRRLASTLARLLLGPSPPGAAAAPAAAAELCARPPTLLDPAAGGAGAAEPSSARCALLGLVSGAADPLAYGGLAVLAAVLGAAGGEEAGGEEMEGGSEGALISAGLLEHLGLLPGGCARATPEPAAQSGAARAAVEPAEPAAVCACDAQVVGALVSLLRRGLGCDGEGFEAGPAARAEPPAPLAERLRRRMASVDLADGAADGLWPRGALGAPTLCAAAELLALLCPAPAALGCAAGSAAGWGARPRCAHAEAISRLVAAGRARGREARAAFAAAAAQRGRDGAEEAERAFERALGDVWRSLPQPLVCARGVGSARGSGGALAVDARTLPRWASLPGPESRWVGLRLDTSAERPGAGGCATRGERGAPHAPAAHAGGGGAPGASLRARHEGHLRAALVGAFLCNAAGAPLAEGGSTVEAGDEPVMLVRLRAFLGVGDGAACGAEAAEARSQRPQRPTAASASVPIAGLRKRDTLAAD